MKRKILLLFLLLLLVLAAAGLSAWQSGRFRLTVLCIGENGCTTEYEKISVDYGRNAVIPLQVPNGQKVIQVLRNGTAVKDYDYEDGRLTVPSITSPTTLRIVSGDPNNVCIVTAEPTSTEAGRVLSTADDWRVPVGTHLTFTAIEKNGGKFIGWTKNDTLKRGSPVISEEKEITVKIEEQSFYYANYDLSHLVVPKKEVVVPKAPKYYRYVRLAYQANGGKYGDSDVFQIQYGLDYYTMANAYPDDGRFTRDGYVLLGYAFDKDGKTGLIRPGYKFAVPEEVISKYSAKNKDGDENQDPELTLYCIWQKAEPAESFSYTAVSDTSVRIDGYHGTNTVVYIPRSIDGKAVTTIGENAFAGSAIEEIYLPSTVLSVMSGAFTDCPALTTLTMYDEILQISDADFTGTTIHHFQLCAAKLPRYSNSDTSFAKKYERLVDCDMPRVITVAGSSKHYGIDSDYAEELLGGQYRVVNYGTNAQMNIVFYLEFIASQVGKDDVVIYSPEQYAPYTYWTSGNPEMTALTFQGCESCYNVFACVDMSNYTSLFDAYRQYAVQRKSIKPMDYENYGKNIDKYGDCSVPRAYLNSPNYHNGANGTFRFCSDFFDYMFLPNMNRAIEEAQANGATVCFSHPPYNLNACDPYCLNDESYDEYQDYLRNVLKAELISDVRDYILEGQYFSNTDYHVNDTGMKMHTEQLMKDLCVYLGMDFPSDTQADESDK